ncbi:MAG: hypothetical protein AM324_007275 [Candidatus Thorarchaeota archaeon SMTZ1-83]|nr:MAG: hypothetical protein AM324_08510 [Candidatus Thorarchaeota archaeon SMTZ1-83]
MTEAWGLLPLAADESDCIMVLLSMFVLVVLVVSIFLVFSTEVALLVSAMILVAFLYALMENRRMSKSHAEQPKKRMVGT